MRRAILGTAGHIDHGKTALVRALTGVDTDRLPEEKARGITIDLGFARLDGGPDLQVGVVDVPGHEDFIRTMVAGATGMDMVLLVVAADEGVMPQTREHLDIVRLLGVPRLVVALTKVDLVDPEWPLLVEDDVRSVLGGTPYADAPLVPVSARTGEGVQSLRDALFATAVQLRARAEEDAVRLPVDRAFTVQGMGTVVTGTLWSGTLAVAAKVRLLPSGAESRVRSLQVHGDERDAARAGERTAVSLPGVDLDVEPRSQVLVQGSGWRTTWMLTVRLGLLDGAPRGVEHGQRVRVLLGTAEVLARCAVLDQAGFVAPGEHGWVQLRLEEPVVARNGDGIILRSYSPLVTIGGGVVAEPNPAKRRRLDPDQRHRLEALATGDGVARVDAALALAGWSGVPLDALVQEACLAPGAVVASVERVAGALSVRGVAFHPGVVGEAAERILHAVEREHADHPLRPVVPLERVRPVLPAWAAAGLADGVLALLAGDGRLVLEGGGARSPHFRPSPTPRQEEALGALRRLYEDAGLAAPFLDDLPPELGSREEVVALLRHLEGEGAVRTVDDGLWIWAEALDAAAAAVTASLGGSTGLGPADFREVLPVSRRHLMPLLAHLDGLGVTVRQGPVRDVPGGQ